MATVASYVLVLAGSFVYFDVCSGPIIHRALDTSFGNIPLLGRFGESFHEHHVDPALMWRKPLWVNTGPVFLAVVLGVWLPVATIIGMIEVERHACPPMVAWALACHLAAALVGELSRRWARAPAARVPRLARALQGWGVLLSPGVHALPASHGLHSERLRTWLQPTGPSTASSPLGAMLRGCLFLLGSCSPRYG